MERSLGSAADQLPQSLPQSDEFSSSARLEHIPRHYLWCVPYFFVISGSLTLITSMAIASRVFSY